MRKIEKGNEPDSLKAWRRSNPQGKYGQLAEPERKAIRESCTKEQFYLCAYCCKAITGDSSDTVNEHVEAQNIAKNRTVDFSNIVASCNTAGQCDDAHGSQALPLTPLMAECETELRFKLSGRVEGLTEQARETIRVLNLGDAKTNNRVLVECRKQLVGALLFQHGIDPQSPVEDDDLISMVIDDLSKPENDKLEPFAPVVVNVLRAWLRR